LGSAAISGEQLVDRFEGGIGHRHLLSRDRKVTCRFHTEGGKVGVKKVTRIDLSISDVGAILVGCSNKRAAVDPRTAKAN
jgi:hypothetical protein